MSKHFKKSAYEYQSRDSVRGTIATDIAVYNSCF